MLIILYSSAKVIFKDFWAGFWAQTHFLQLRPLKSYINQAAGSPPDNTKEHPVSLKIRVFCKIWCSADTFCSELFFATYDESNCLRSDRNFSVKLWKSTTFPYHPILDYRLFISQVSQSSVKYFWVWYTDMGPVCLTVLCKPSFPRNLIQL